MQFSVVRNRARRLWKAVVILTVAGLMTGCLAGILTSAGDESGGQAVMTLVYIVLTVLAVAVLTLVGQLTVAVLLLIDVAESSSDRHDERSDLNSLSSS